MTTLADLLPRVAEPARPLITYEHRGTGERVELSATTTANWVAKTANFLVDDLDAGPGTRLRVALPCHWLRPVWVLSAWTVGACLVDTGADIGLSGPELRADEQHRLAASLRPMGARFAETPTGFLDIGAEVPGQGDVFVPFEAPGPQTPAIDLDGLTATHAELLERAEPSSRRLLVGPGSLEDEALLLVDLLLGGGSLVLAVDASEQDLATIAAQEHATRR